MADFGERQADVIDYVSPFPVVVEVVQSSAQKQAVSQAGKKRRDFWQFGDHKEGHSGQNRRRQKLYQPGFLPAEPENHTGIFHSIETEEIMKKGSGQSARFLPGVHPVFDKKVKEKNKNGRGQ